MKMTENLIHVKLEYDEALQSKKDVLSSELGLLQIVKAIKKHRLLRSDELKTKEKLYGKIKELKTNIGKLQQILPKLKVPAILKEHEETEKEDEFQIEKRAHDDSLEAQLQEIQERLREIG